MPSPIRADDIAELEDNAQDAASFLKAVANEKRLLVLCALAGEGEMTVNRLAETVGLSQSALSQHLSRLRDDGLVAHRREAQSLHYSIDDPKTLQLLTALRQIFCP